MYLQDMLDLEYKLIPDEDDKFANQGVFTFRRSDKSWSSWGLWKPKVGCHMDET